MSTNAPLTPEELARVLSTQELRLLEHYGDPECRCMESPDIVEMVYDLATLREQLRVLLGEHRHLCTYRYGGGHGALNPAVWERAARDFYRQLTDIVAPLEGGSAEKGLVAGA